MEIEILDLGEHPSAGRRARWTSAAQVIVSTRYGSGTEYEGVIVITSMLNMLPLSIYTFVYVGTDPLDLSHPPSPNRPYDGPDASVAGS